MRLFNQYKIKRALSLFRFVFLLVIASFIFYDQRVSSCEAADSDAGTIIGLQQFRSTSSGRIKGTGSAEGSATLINPNPNVNAWHLLRLDWRGSVHEVYHLENAKPEVQKIILENGYPFGLVIVNGKDRYLCDLWGENSRGGIKAAAKSSAPYAPLCDGRIFLRNPTRGHQTGIEAMTDFLRDKIPGGEKIISSVRDSFFKYRYQKKAEEKVESAAPEIISRRRAEGGPAPALPDKGEAGRIVNPPDLGIELEEPGRAGMIPGDWYAVRGNPGIYVSVIIPKWISPEVMRSSRKTVNALDSVESSGLVYLTAFDLSRFDLKFALGTDHPRVGWSTHIPDRMRDGNLPGPDGIDKISPLISTGLINPMDAGRTAATFTGGFKRIHGAFKYGRLSLKNHGSHYGFIENGVLFSRLQPELSTLYVLDNGFVGMKTWTEEDNKLLPEIRYARQNGVSLIEGFDKAAGFSIPGELVGKWGAGNWSGSSDSKLRTLRAGVGLQEFEGKRFLIYAFFWSATPSAMARVFQAYQCNYAMHLDMNAPVHTYLAIYRRQDQNVYVGHLIGGMGEADMTAKGRRIPRFLATADDRDFFYLTRKEKQ